MATRMQQRRGTAQQWTTANPILNVAEIGYETDTNKFKIGDGTNHWADLTYFVDAGELASIVDGAPALLDTLNELAAAIGDDPAFMTTVATNLSNHQSDTTNIHGIANTADLATQSYVNTAVGNIDLSTKQDVVSGVSSTEIGYLDGVTSKIQDQLDAKASSTDLSNHSSDTTSVHGIADTSLLVTTAGTQTLSNKTLSNPVVSQSGDVTVLTYTGGFYAYGENGTRFMMFTNLGLDSEITSDLVGTYVTIASGVWAGTHLITGYLPQNPVWSNQVYPVLYFPGGGNYDTPQSASLTFVESVTATISAVEISYLDGVTSNIQTQLNAKLASADAYTDADAVSAVSAALVSNGGIEYVVNTGFQVDTDIIATKAYADSIAQGLDIKDSVVVASTANVDIALFSPMADSIDGVTLYTGNRVLLKNQSNASENGIYILNNIDSLVRADDATFDTATGTGTLTKGSFTFVEQGTNAGHGFVVSAVDVSLGSYYNNWTQFSDSAAYITSSTSNFSVMDGELDISATFFDNRTLDAPTITGSVNATPFTVDTTEISYLDGVTSSIQDQLDDKATLTGTETLSNKTLEAPTVTVSAGVSFSMNPGYIDTDGSSGTAYTFYDDQPGYSDFVTYVNSLPIVNGARTGDIIITGVTSGGYISGTNTANMLNMGNSIIVIWPSIAYQSGATFSSPTIGWGGSTITVSATEISYLDGVTSAIQTQLDDKAPLDSPTFTGTVDLTGATVTGLPEAGPTAVEIIMGVY